jgi:hypothetical protein
MDPKQQAVMFYKSLAASDEFACKLLAQGGRIQRGRVVALESHLAELQKNPSLQDEATAVQAEITKRKDLAAQFDKLDAAITKALDERAAHDKGKFG